MNEDKRVYDQPNKDNIKKGDFLIVPEDRSYRKVPINNITEYSVEVEFNRDDDKVNLTSPYVKSIIQKQNGVILVGKVAIEDKETQGLLKHLSN